MFTIKHFDDYHEITDSKSHKKAIELGCFVPKRGNYGYYRYFGLFYTGRRPSLKDVMEKLDNIVHYGHFFYKEKYGGYMGRVEVEKEVRGNLA